MNINVLAENVFVLKALSSSDQFTLKPVSYSVSEVCVPGSVLKFTGSPLDWSIFINTQMDGSALCLQD